MLYIEIGVIGGIKFGCPTKSQINFFFIVVCIYSITYIVDIYV